MGTYDEPLCQAPPIVVEVVVAVGCEVVVDAFAVVGGHICYSYNKIN